MDVSKWQLDRIMELPDWCFGKRWWVGVNIGTALGEAVPFIIEESVPDVFVLWDLIVLSAVAEGQTRTDLTIRLCREAPTTVNVKTFRRLMRGLSQPQNMFEVQLPADLHIHLGPMRNLVEARNDRIGGLFKRLNATATQEAQIAFLISGIPKEVPDWVVSGLAGVRS